MTQTVEITADRRTFEVPREIPAGRVIINFTPETPPPHECPICANSTPNAETIAAIQEGRAMMRGEIPAKRFSSLDEMWEDLMRDDADDASADD